MNGWSPNDVTGSSVGKIVDENATDSPISNEFGISAGGALNCQIKIYLVDVMVAVGITAKLQTAIGDDWVDNKTVAVTTDGAVYIKLLATDPDDLDFLPLLGRGRIVLTTGAGDTATVQSVQVLQEL